MWVHHPKSRRRVACASEYKKKADKTKLKQDVKFKIVNLYVFPKENTENKKVF